MIAVFQDESQGQSAWNTGSLREIANTFGIFPLVIVSGGLAIRCQVMVSGLPRPGAELRACGIVPCGLIRSMRMDETSMCQTH